METLLQQLLERLEGIGEQHEELYDTDVRERISDALYQGLVLHDPAFTMPSDFGMFSEEGNRAVQQAIAAYLEAAVEKAEALGLDQAGRERALWNDAVTTEGGQTVDDFFGAI